ncbi:MAG: CinA family protein [Erysipelotrichaceae bacterium]|nr:CinA family protein [Erysipelotrichaceae bacterium]
MRNIYREITNLLIENHLTITTMESMTSGFIASLITDTEGSSSVMKGAFVTYSNEAKVLQGVPKEVIDMYGVYSKECAMEMARAAREAYGADISIGITGSTGNVDPNNQDSIPGVVYYAIDYQGDIFVEMFEMPRMGERYLYKEYAAKVVGEKLLEIIKKSLAGLS